MKKNKTRIIIVLFFIIIFALITFINLRGTYLEYKELGENYKQAFFTTQKYKYSIFGINFVVLYFLMYFTNKGIKKGLKEFFKKDSKEMPKLINKSISFIFSVIISVFTSNILMEKILLASSNASFGVTDPIYGLDISFYMFQKPLIEVMLLYFIIVTIAISIYMTIYYIIVFNKHFDGVDSKMLKNSLLVKKLMRNVILVVIAISLLTALNTTNISLNKMLTIDNTYEQAENIDIIGASYTDIMIERWAYLVFAVVIVIFAIRAIKAFKKDDISKVIRNLSIIPTYLIVMFLALIVFDMIFVNSNTLDKEKQYLEYNIRYTKNAYNINIEEQSMESTGTITQAEVVENDNIIDNIKIVNTDIVLKTLQDSQTETGHYSYRNAHIAKYEVDGEYKLVYVSPREIINSGRTYNNKTYEYTHGRGQILVDATSFSEIGTVNYIQKEVSGDDNVTGADQQEIYFGLETNDTIATNTKNKKEYDYTDENGVEHTSTYNGEAGLQLNFIDRLILGIKTGDLKLAFSNEITNQSKILINRNVIERAKKVMPYLIYDEEPYTVVSGEGETMWVLDAYTVSSQYPYSQYTSIEHDNIREKINYIRNSVKVIIDAYDGTMKFYITDKTDPIAMAYRNVYADLFEDINEEIPQDISEHFIYPKYLYNVQAELLKIYHNVKPDVLYRTDDLWDFAKYNSTIISKSSGSILKPYYTMINKEGKTEIGLMQIYTPESKQNLISYLVGTTDGSENKLKLYKFSQDSNILGPMQLDNQIEQDELISTEIQSLNTTGTKVTKDMVVVPINNTLLYIESIYQTMLNEESKIPVLKKIVVASGNKVAMGEDLKSALENLLSKEASNIEVESTDDVDGLIDAIIKANKNLSESTSNNDWELMGSDIKKLQSLIDLLEVEKDKEDREKEEETEDLQEITDENIIM